MSARLDLGESQDECTRLVVESMYQESTWFQHEILNLAAKNYQQDQA